MAKMITPPLNLTVFGYWSSFVDALSWVEEAYLTTTLKPISL